jgi:hypothetical protein
VRHGTASGCSLVCNAWMNSVSRFLMRLLLAIVAAAVMWLWIYPIAVGRVAVAVSQAGAQFAARPLAVYHAPAVPSVAVVDCENFVQMAGGARHCLSKQSSSDSRLQPR